MLLGLKSTLLACHEGRQTLSGKLVLLQVNRSRLTHLSGKCPCCCCITSCQPITLRPDAVIRETRHQRRKCLSVVQRGNYRVLRHTISTCVCVCVSFSVHTAQFVYYYSLFNHFTCYLLSLSVSHGRSI